MFYRRSEESPEAGAGTAQEPAYSFSEDADVIAAAFQRVYGIDLSAARIHWWRFCALLNGLLIHTFEDRVRYRLVDPEEIKNGRERSVHRKYKRVYALDRRGRHKQEPTTLEEYNAQLLRMARREEV